MLVELKDGAITTLQLTRPERRNALSHELVLQLADGLARAEADAACRCVVITGSNGTFCSGRDLGDAKATMPAGDAFAYDEDYARIFFLLADMSKPTVAVVEGYAVAGGFTLAMACDFVLAEAGTQFGALEMRGNFPAAVNTAVLTHLVGRRQSLEYLLSADLFPAEHLHRNGLINRIEVGAEALSRAAKDVAARLTALDPLAVKLTKDAQRMAANMPLRDAVAMGRQLNTLLMTSGMIANAASARKKA